MSEERYQNSIKTRNIENDRETPKETCISLEKIQNLLMI